LHVGRLGSGESVVVSSSTCYPGVDAENNFF
jgi:hypothetical protein